MAHLVPVIIAQKPFRFWTGSEIINITRFSGTQWDGTVVPVAGIMLERPQLPRHSRIKHYVRPINFGNVVACKQVFHGLTHFDQYFIDVGVDELSVNRLLRALDLVVSETDIDVVERHAQFLSPYFSRGKKTVEDYREYLTTYRPDQTRLETLLKTVVTRGGFVRHHDLRQAIDRNLLESSPLIESIIDA